LVACSRQPGKRMAFKLCGDRAAHSSIRTYDANADQADLRDVWPRVA
jgi:hypothetical protein